MPLGRITGRRERQYVAGVINCHGIEVGIDPFDDFAVSLSRIHAHLGEDWRGALGYLAGSKSNPHVVGDAWLAWRVDLARAELWNVDARFDSCAAAHLN